MASLHKIPQNVTSYEGRIIGRFTAKQFIFLAIGAIAIFLVWNLPMARNIRIILSVIFGGLSLLFSLVNFDGRSTDVWISNFIRGISEPTQRIWDKTATAPAYMMPNYKPPQIRRGPRKRNTNEIERFIKLYQPPVAGQDYDEEENAILSRLRQIRQSTPNGTTLTDVSRNNPNATDPSEEGYG